MEMVSNGLESLLNWCGIFGWSWSRMGWSIWMEVVSNDLEYLE
jgi:hypothetical protein